jgi:hypothetical protein
LSFGSWFIVAVINTFSGLHCESSPFGDPPAEPYFLRTAFRREWLLLYTKLIVGLVADKRVVSPDLSVTFILAAKALLAEPAYVTPLFIRLFMGLFKCCLPAVYLLLTCCFPVVQLLLTCLRAAHLFFICCLPAHLLLTCCSPAYLDSDAC